MVLSLVYWKKLLDRSEPRCLLLFSFIRLFHSQKVKWNIQFGLWRCSHLPCKMGIAWSELAVNGPWVIWDCLTTLLWIAFKWLLSSVIQVDMFSYGMVLYELLSGRRPCMGQHQLQIAKKLSKGLRPALGTPEEVQFHCLQAFMQECWDTKPEKVQRGSVFS